jgi:hypothetical protein
MGIGGGLVTLIPHLGSALGNPQPVESSGVIAKNLPLLLWRNLGHLLLDNSHRVWKGAVRVWVVGGPRVWVVGGPKDVVLVAELDSARPTGSSWKVTQKLRFRISLGGMVIWRR